MNKANVVLHSQVIYNQNNPRAVVNPDKYAMIDDYSTDTNKAEAAVTAEFDNSTALNAFKVSDCP
jgi:hypothetical protein